MNSFAEIAGELSASRRELNRQNQQWQISFASLKIEEREKKRKEQESSQSHLSVSTNTSHATNSSTKYTIDTALAESKTYAIYLLHGAEKVVAQRHDLSHSRVLTGAEDAAELRAMRACDHDNVNRFHGLSLDAPETLLSVWRYCQRGSLRDVISNNTLARDGVFIYSIVSDLCEGMAYIHSDASKLGWHGSLRSAACLVDER